MGISRLSIKYYKPGAVYHPGQVLAGKAILFVDSPQNIKALEIEIKGKAKVQWEKRESYTDEEKRQQFRTIHYKAKEKYLCNKLYLIKDETKLMVGEQAYDFCLILPNSLPSSFKGELGSIEYSAKAKVHIPMSIHKKVKSAFTIVNQLNLNSFSNLKKPERRERNKNFCCLCCASGPLTLCCYLPKTGFVPGEIIPLTIEVDNASNVRVDNVNAYIEQHVTWTSEIPEKKERCTSSKLHSVSIGGVSPGSSKTWSEGISVPESLRFPCVSKCNIINIQYELHIEADPEGPHTDLDINIPVQFGVVPLWDDKRNKKVFDFGNLIGVHPSHAYYNTNYQPIPSAPLLELS